MGPKVVVLTSVQETSAIILRIKTMELYLEKVVFAIDNNTDTHVVAKFLRHVDTLRAMGTIAPIVQCIGNWENVLEVSYMMDLKDFDKHVLSYGFTREQECILVVAGDTRQPCHLRFPDGSTKSVGPMVEIDGPIGNWTYVPATNKYFTCK